MNSQKSKTKNSSLNGRFDSKNEYGIKNLLKNKNFRNLWIGQIFSQLADKFYIVLMIFLISQQLSHGYLEIKGAINLIQSGWEDRGKLITTLATGVYVANTLPAIIFGLMAGIFTDRWPKQKILFTSTLLKSFLVLLIPISLIKGPIIIGVFWGYWSILILTFSVSFLTQFFTPAEQSVIPLIVAEENLVSANSLYQLTNMGSIIIGFALGEPLIQLMRNIFLILGIQGGEYLLLPLFYGFSALFISKLKVVNRENITNKDNYLAGLKDAFNTVIKTPSIRIAMINLVILYSLLASLYVLAISLASSIEGLGPTKFGSLLSTTGSGIAIGAICLPYLNNRIKLQALNFFGLINISLCLVILCFVRGSLISTLIICFFIGVGAALIAIPSQTALQRDTPERKRGKVFGLQNNLINVSLGIPLVVIGVLISFIGLNAVLGILGSIALFAALIEQPWNSGNLN